MLEGKRLHSAYSPDNFGDYNYNKYWYMWDIYKMPSSGIWDDPNWNGAQVPPLRDYMQECILQGG